MAWGGKRQGAGRKPGVRAKLYEETRIYIGKRIKRNLKPLIDAMLKEAKGGSYKAFAELFDRAFGKPAQPLTGDDGGPITMAQVLNQLEDDRPKTPGQKLANKPPLQNPQ